MSSADLIRFCGSYTDCISELSIIRNDGMEDRYSVVIQFADQLKAYGFYCNFNGNRFSPAEMVEYIESSEMASISPKGFTELPTCPVCLERLDQDTSGILIVIIHINVLALHIGPICLARLCQLQDDKPSCFICGTLENLWVCLICGGFVGCGRYNDRHALRHWKKTEHCYTLDLKTRQVWDYVGHTYVHRLNQSKADGKSTMLSSHCKSLEGNCVSCGCSEDSEISGVLYSSKTEAVLLSCSFIINRHLIRMMWIRNCFPGIKTLPRDKFNESHIF